MKRFLFGWTIVVFGLSIFFLNPVPANALEQAGKYTLGDMMTIESKILGEKRGIYVHLPLGYHKSKEKYPVLYLLDGGRSFALGVSTVQYFYNSAAMPKMIVIGIPNTNRIRDLSHAKLDKFPKSGQAARFIDFLKKELIPAVDKKFRTRNFRVLWGHSLAGLFATHIMVKHPGMFNAYITATPWFLLGDKAFLKESKSLLAKHKELRKFYYFFVGNEPEIEGAVKEFNDVLTAAAPKGLKWSFHHLKKEDHNTIVPRSISSGLLQLYSGWAVTPKLMARGLKDVQGHFRVLSRKYGYEIKVPADVLNRMGFRALGGKKFKEALPIFHYLVKLYPNYWIGYHNLGYCYQATGEKQKAIANYQESLKINPDNIRATQQLEKLKSGN